VTNCILWGNNAPTSPQWDSLLGMDPNYCCIQDWTKGGLGNIAQDPCFVDNGYWDSNDTPDDATDDFWVQGDYHPKSEGWRWDNQMNQWSWDAVTSRCIDAGSPGTPLNDEPLTLIVDPENRFGSNLRINMGAYGGTEHAAMPPFDWALLADMTNDGTVGYADLAVWVMDFLGSGDNLHGDLNMLDFALFMQDWTQQTSWWLP